LSNSLEHFRVFRLLTLQRAEVLKRQADIAEGQFASCLR
jgi:hypothetical protein